MLITARSPHSVRTTVAELRREMGPDINVTGAERGQAPVIALSRLSFCGGACVNRESMQGEQTWLPKTICEWYTAAPEDCWSGLLPVRLPPSSLTTGKGLVPLARWQAVHTVWGRLIRSKPPAIANGRTAVGGARRAAQARTWM